MSQDVQLRHAKTCYWGWNKGQNSAVRTTFMSVETVPGTHSTEINFDSAYNYSDVMWHLHENAHWKHPEEWGDRNCLLLAELVPTFEDRGCHVVSVKDHYDPILSFLDRSHYFFFQVAPKLYSRGWVDPVPDPLLLRKSGSAENRTQTSGSVARNSDWNLNFEFFIVHFNLTRKLYCKQN
jgi:hypothetical protein